MSDRLPSGQFPPGVSGNPGGKRKGPTLTKTVRLLLADDPDAWAAVREIESDPSNTEGKHELIKLAVSTVRRARTDNTVLREVFDRVDGKLAAAYTLPDEDDNTRIIRPILYVAPEDPEVAERLFAAFYDAEPVPALPDPLEQAAVPGQAVVLLDAAGPIPEGWRPADTSPPVREGESKPSDTGKLVRALDVSGRVIGPGPRDRK